MSGTFVDFAPSSTAAFSFQPVFASNSYIVSVPWNFFAERYYLSVSDSAGNLIFLIPLVESGPTFQVQFTWNDGVASVLYGMPHKVPVGQLVNITITGSGTTFDGEVMALATDDMTMTYALSVQPVSSTVPASGVVDFALNLLAGYISDASLLFHADKQQFEY